VIQASPVRRPVATPIPRSACRSRANGTVTVAQVRTTAFGAGVVALANEFLGYLDDRNYSPRTVRGYAFDLLQLARWLSHERLVIDDVTTETLLAACRSASLPGHPGGNVYSIRDGRNAGYAPATINRRLAAISGLFAFRAMRYPTAPNPVPRGPEAQFVSHRQRGGLIGHLSKPKPRSALSVREPRRLPRGLDSQRALVTPRGTVRRTLWFVEVSTSKSSSRIAATADRLISCETALS
jgi:integrase/recombinase XerC